MSTKPEMRDVIDLVFPRIKAKWEYVAYRMNYKPHEVSGFMANDSDRSCLNLFTDWLTTDHGITPKTWYTLIKQIKAVDGLQNVAEFIDEEVKKLNV